MADGPGTPIALNFDARSVAPSQPFEPLPTGWYDVKIVSSEAKPTKDAQTDGSGDYYLELTMEVLSGQFKGRKVFDRLNLKNKNPTAQEIAWRTMSAICHATGVLQVQSSHQLHNVPMQARVVLKPARTDGDRTYEASNDVKGYKPVENAQGGMPAGAPSTGAPAWAAGQPAAAPAAAPWGNAPAPAPVPAPAPAPAPAAAPAAPPSYKEGDIVNGYQLTNGQWVPAPPQAAPPAPPAPPAGPPAVPPVTNGGPAWGSPPAGAPAGGGAPPWARS